MTRICLVLPLLPGAADALRDFYADVEGDRRAGYESTERRLGVTLEAVFIHEDNCLMYWETDRGWLDVLRTLADSQDEFDLWFKQGLIEMTGLDFNNPPETQPESIRAELLSIYDVRSSAVAS
jgi:hypothetical protein